jgi:hypothetical protein
MEEAGAQVATMVTPATAGLAETADVPAHPEAEAVAERSLPDSGEPARPLLPKPRMAETADRAATGVLVRVRLKETVPPVMAVQLRTAAKVWVVASPSTEEL